MLSTLVPAVSKKCLKLPLFGGVMEDFADWLVQQGYARLHIRATLNVVRKQMPEVNRSHARQSCPRQ